MPSGKIHRENSLKKFGKDYAWLHEWMDEPSQWLGDRHRKERHGWLTVLSIRLWHGKEAAEACRQHIEDDRREAREKAAVRFIIAATITVFILLVPIVFLLSIPGIRNDLTLTLTNPKALQEKQANRITSADVLKYWAFQEIQKREAEKQASTTDTNESQADQEKETVLVQTCTNCPPIKIQK